MFCCVTNRIQKYKKIHEMISRNNDILILCLKGLSLNIKLLSNMKKVFKTWNWWLIHPMNIKWNITHGNIDIIRQEKTNLGIKINCTNCRTKQCGQSFLVLKMFSPFYIYLITIIKLNQVKTFDTNQFITEKVNTLGTSTDENVFTSPEARLRSLSPKASSLHQTIVPFEEGKFSRFKIGEILHLRFVTIQISFT